MARVRTATPLTFQSDENHTLKSCLDHRDGEQTAVREDTATEVTQENMLSEKMGWWQVWRWSAQLGGEQGSKRREKKVTSKRKLDHEGFFGCQSCSKVNWVGAAAQLAGSWPSLQPLCPTTWLLPCEEVFGLTGLIVVDRMYERMQFSTGYLSKTETGKRKTEQNKQTTKPQNTKQTEK